MPPISVPQGHIDRARCAGGNDAAQMMRSRFPHDSGVPTLHEHEKWLCAVMDNMARPL
ncbi:hypothetical protein L227DRAFT_576968 [Lentinus tigrinus ALCF2SS1-6]|uniref:Uncharacterized protein n=1 Tax=Lentinus tigrinus ALCF2SS1-6 TaxID=1328759 RepID=A0A5C2S6C0_9APHY|nr:hypothetical protein L227DRAFT_576968 [Lentinus tigrinus ALCF2SS1-6]